LRHLARLTFDIGKMAEIATANVVILLVMLVFGIVLIRLMRYPFHINRLYTVGLFSRMRPVN
jgi:uncharacterized membrane protein (DUF373 family)